MNKCQLKPLFLAVLFLLIGMPISAQVIKLKATGISMRYELDNGQWTEWDPITAASDLITVNLDTNKITIRAKETLEYNISGDEEIETTNDGEESMAFYCVDNNDKICRIKYIKTPTAQGQNKFTISYVGYKYYYNVKVVN